MDGFTRPRGLKDDDVPKIFLPTVSTVTCLFRERFPLLRGDIRSNLSALNTLLQEEQLIKSESRRPLKHTQGSDNKNNNDRLCIRRESCLNSNRFQDGELGGPPVACTV